MDLTEILHRIEQSDDAEISQIIDAVIRRYRICYPDWEILFLSIPTADTEKRKRSTEEMIAFVRRFL